MQQSDATPGSLQNPVSEQFGDHFGRVPGGKIHPKSQKRVPKTHAKKQQIFGRAFFRLRRPSRSDFEPLLGNLGEVGGMSGAV